MLLLIRAAVNTPTVPLSRVLNMPDDTRNRFRLTCFLFGLAAIHGLLVNLTPVMFTTMEKNFGVDESNQALLKSCFFIGTSAALLVSGYLTILWGPRRVTIVSGVVTGFGALFFGVAPTYPLILAATCVLGAGIAPVMALYAAVIASEFSHNSQRMFMLTYAMLAASAAAATLTIGVLLDVLDDNFRPVFVGLAFVIWAAMAANLAFAYHALDGIRRENKTADGDGTSGHRQATSGNFIRSGIFGRGALYLFCLLMVCDYLCSSNAMAWLPKLFERLYEDSRTLAGLTLTASSLGVLVGRLIMGSFPPGRVPDLILLGICYLAGVMSFGVIILFEPSLWVSFTMVFLSGAFIAAQAPTMGSLAVRKFGDLAPMVIPIYEAVGTVASIFGPPVVGQLAERHGLAQVLWIVPAAGFVLAATSFTWYFWDRQYSRPAS